MPSGAIWIDSPNWVRSMPDDLGRLFVSDIAPMVGISESDWRARVSRGHAPACDGHVLHEGAVRSVWESESVDAYLAARRARRALRPAVPISTGGDGNE